MMKNAYWKKALIIQSLFFYSLCFAQNIYIDKPLPGDPLEDTQQFKVSITDAQATRVDFYLNGRLVQARQKPPWLFRASWNTRYENDVRFEATLENGEKVSVSRKFREIKADVEEALEVFQFFPLVESPGSPVEMRSQGEVVKPKRYGPAGDSFPLHLNIILDVSGSMKFSLKELSPAMHELLKHGQEQGWEVRVLLFDNAPKLIHPKDLPLNLEDLYEENARSVVYDAMATACELFPKGPRRILLLISDGRDDGSMHDGNSAGLYLRKSRASFIWLSPARLKNEVLIKLTDLSGGYTSFLEPGRSWNDMIRLFDTQYHLLAPDAAYPVKLKGRGKVYYPKWAQ